MPDFEITLPNGTKIGGTAPEGVSQEQIIAEYEKQYNTHKENFLSIFGGGLAKGFLGGGTAGEPRQLEETEEDYQARTTGIPQLLEEKFPTPKSLSGRVVQGIGEGLGSPTNLVGAPGLISALGRTAASVASGVGSELGGLATGDSLAGRIAGGIAGGAVPRAAVRTGGRVAGAVAPRPGALPPSVPPERAAPVATLRAAGVEPTAGDVLGSRFVRSLERNADRVYGESYQRLKTEVMETFTRAVSQEIGEDATRLTPEIFQRAETRIGNVFQRVANELPFPQDRQLGNRLQAIMAEMFRFRYADAEINRIAGLIEDINEGFTSSRRTGFMDGRAYQSKTNYGSQLSRATRDPNSNVAHYAQQVKDALNDSLFRYVQTRVRTAFQRGQAGGPARQNAIRLAEAAEGLQTARRQWRNMLALQKSITGPGEVPAQGLVLPERLRAALTSGADAKAAYATGQGRLVELANAGTSVIEPYRPAGWAEWAVAHAPWTALGLLAGGPLSLKSAAMMATPDLMGRAVNSRTLQNMLKNQRATSLLNQLEGARNIAARSAVQATATQPQQNGLVRPQSLMGKRPRDYAEAFGRGGLMEVGRAAGIDVPKTGVEQFLHREDVDTAIGMVGSKGIRKGMFDAAIKKGLAAGKSFVELAKELGVSHQSLRNQAANLGIKSINKGGGGRYKNVPDWFKQEMKQ